MSVLITGGAGYVGSHIALELLDHGEDVVIADNLSTGIATLIPDGAGFFQTDIRDEAAMAHLIRNNGVTTVVHCAGSTVVPESVRDPLKYYANNTEASLALLRVAASERISSIIFSSTAAVYQPLDARPISETANIIPTTPYGMSKLMTERFITDIAPVHGISYFILRYFNVAGADPIGRSGQSTPQATHLIKIAAEVACGQRPDMHIFGTDWPTKDGTGVRDYIHVSDLAKAHRLAIRHLKSGGDSHILNCGYGHGYSVREIVDLMTQLSGNTVTAFNAGRRPGDLGEVIANSDKLRAILGWEPDYNDLEKILSHALKWQRQCLAAETS